MTRKRDPEEVAAERLQLITPLLDPSLDHAALVERKKKICEEAHLSYRSVSRYLERYRNEGFSGLKPCYSYVRSESTLPENFPELLEGLNTANITHRTSTEIATSFRRFIEEDA